MKRLLFLRTTWIPVWLYAFQLGLIVGVTGLLFVRLRPYWVAKYHGMGADLHSVSLRGAPLRGAELGTANLQGADLLSADLREANLSSTLVVKDPTGVSGIGHSWNGG